MKRRLLILLSCLLAVVGPAVDAARPQAAARAPNRVDSDIAAFYASRGGRPLWIAGGRLKPEAEALLSALAFAGRNGFDPERYRAREIRQLAEKGRGGDKIALARAELDLSAGFVRYANDLRRGSSTLYAEPGLAPRPVAAAALLGGAAQPASLSDYLRRSLAMNPLYETLRAAYGRGASRLAPAQRRVVERNLERLRAIPADPAGRWILVDAGGARLWMIEGGRVAGSMRVIVGKPGMQTPVMAARLRYAILNPFWNMPPDLVRERAKRVLRSGPGFLSAERLQLLSDWGPAPHVLAPSRVDWRAVAARRQYLRIRQLPGGANVMGAIKFMMPNDLGIYLHDFPDKSLFARADRHLSSGCVRLEDAQRLAGWLFGGGAPRPRGSAAEQQVSLPRPVPVYVVYLTAFPSGNAIAFRRDVYRRDDGPTVRHFASQDPADRSGGARRPR